MVGHLGKECGLRPAHRLLYRAVRAATEGVKPDDVKLSVENNLLTIRGEKKQAAEERNERGHRYERSYGSKAERARPREIPVRTA